MLMKICRVNLNIFCTVYLVTTVAKIASAKDSLVFAVKYRDSGSIFTPRHIILKFNVFFLYDGMLNFDFKW